MTPSSKSQEQKLRQSQPLVILGMHRSGTSLMVRLLMDLGIHMGSRLSRDAEAIFFQKVNREIYRSKGVKWGYVDPLIQAMRDESFIQEKADVVVNALFPVRSIYNFREGISVFFGMDKWQNVCQDRRIWWGWKDPRTTITFPIWLRVFPNARFLHILRNGIDVAISTHRRSLRQRQKLYKRLFPLDYCPITLDFEYCFHLWESHVSHVYEHRHFIEADHFLEIRYEELLVEPVNQLRKVTDFIEFPVQEQLLAAAGARVDKNRLDNSQYSRIYKDQIPILASNPLLQQLGYRYEIAN